MNKASFLLRNKTLDTNIFLRHLLQDIPGQSEQASAIISNIEEGKITGFLSILVLNELIWILERYYKIDRKIFLNKILSLIHLEYLKIIETKKEIIIKSLNKMKEKKIDFTDVYLSQIALKSEILSFDKDLK